MDAIAGVDRAKAAEIVAAGKIPAAVADQAAEVIVKLWETFVAEDATLVEVNPLVRDPQDRVVALDGKVTLDGNADFRHPGHADLVDERTENPLEAKAKAKNLNYVKLDDGQVGIIGNGAGLVMSTLDVVAYAGERHGGVKPANFLDIGGGASAKVMADGLDVILRRPGRASSVFVNVFGGITACDAVANGIVEALKILGDAATKPLVVRLDGNNVVEGRRILDEANHPLVTQVDTMDDAADKAAELAAAGGGLIMAIFLNEQSKVIVQGLTGAEGTKHATKMLAAGTNIVGGVNARKAGTLGGDRRAGPAGVRHGRGGDEGDRRGRVGGVRAAAVRQGRGGRGGRRRDRAGRGDHRGHPGARLGLVLGARRARPATGPGSSARTARGSSRPGKSNAGIIPADIAGPGRIGLVSKSGTLTYQMMYELREIGFSTAIGIGGDPIIGTTHIDALEAFEADPETAAIVMIGEIGGDAEERAADFVKANVTKPVVGYVAGFTAPEGKTMGHAGRDRVRLGRHRPGQAGGAGGRRRPGRQDPQRDRRTDARDRGVAVARRDGGGREPRHARAARCAAARTTAVVRPRGGSEMTGNPDASDGGRAPADRGPTAAGRRHGAAALRSESPSSRSSPPVSGSSSTCSASSTTSGRAR